MKRPFRVELATYLMAAGIIMSLAVAWTTSPPPGFTIFISTNTGLGATFVALLEGAIVLAFWNRMSWAMWAVLVLSLLWLVHMLVWFLPWGSLQLAWRQDWSYVVLMFAKFFLALFLISYLSSNEARSWLSRSMDTATGPKA
jgi:hypothetical protein